MWPITNEETKAKTISQETIENTWTAEKWQAFLKRDK